MIKSPLRAAIAPILLLAIWVTAPGGNVEVIAQDTRWEVLPTGPVAAGSRHDDIDFIDDMNGWIGNGSGEVHRTQDGGQTWERLVSGQDGMPYIRALAMGNKDIGFIGTFGGGPGNVLWQTWDGGERWTNISHLIRGTAPAAICGLYAVNENVIYGVGAYFDGPWFIRSTNGGLAWSGRLLGGNIRTIIDVYFQDEDTGFVVGGTGENLDGDAIILRTTNKGASWTEVYRGNSDLDTRGEWGWKISFPTDDVGYVSVEYLNAAAGTPAKVLKTVDGGLTWEEILIPGSTDPNGLQSVGFLTPDVGWTSGRRITSMTTDGGATWQQIDGYHPVDNPEGGLDGATNRIHVVSPTLAYAVGRYTYKFDGATPVFSETVTQSIPQLYEVGQNYPNPFDETTTINYTLHDDAPVKLRVIDMIGRTVRTLVDERQGPGRHSVVWDGTSDTGDRLPSGAYVYMADIGESFEIKRMVLIN